MDVHGKRQPESLVCQNPKTFLQTGRYASKTIRMQKESLRETNFEATVARFEFPRRKVLDPGGALGRFASPAAGHPEKSSAFKNGPLLVVPCLFGKTGSRNLVFSASAACVRSFPRISRCPARCISSPARRSLTATVGRKTSWAVDKSCVLAGTFPKKAGSTFWKSV